MKQDKSNIAPNHRYVFDLLAELHNEGRDFVSSSEFCWLYDRRHTSEPRSKESILGSLQFFLKLGLVEYATRRGYTDGAWRLHKNADINRLKRYAVTKSPLEKVLDHV